MNSFRWVVPGMFVTHSHFPSCVHLLGFPHLREGTGGQTLATTGCGFHLRLGYTGSQALERQILLTAKTGNQFCDQGSGAPFALKLMVLEGRGFWASSWGHHHPLPAFYIVAPSYDIKSLDHEAPIHLYHCCGDQCY